MNYFKLAYVRFLLWLVDALQWEYGVLQHQQTRNLSQRNRVIEYLADLTQGQAGRAFLDLYNKVSGPQALPRLERRVGPRAGRGSPARDDISEFFQSSSEDYNRMRGKLARWKIR